MSSEDAFNYTRRSSGIRIDHTTDQLQFDEEDISTFFPAQSLADIPSNETTTSTSGLHTAQTVPVASDLEFIDTSSSASHTGLHDISQSDWFAADDQAAWQTSAPWNTTTNVEYPGIPSFPTVPYGPAAPLPIDQFGSQAPYPYALERLNDASPWNHPGVSLAPDEAPFMLFPSSAHTISSSQNLYHHPILPVAYSSGLPQPSVSPSEDGRAPRKKFRRDLESPPELLNPASLIRFHPGYEQPAAVQPRPPAAPRPIQVSTHGPIEHHAGEPPGARAQSSNKRSRSSLPDTSAKTHVLLHGDQNIASTALTTTKQRPTRKGPLTEIQKERMEAVRYLGACWRCRRYKKPCNAGAAICNNCLTSGLRLWPGSIGCRRGDFTEFAMTVLPEGMEDAMRGIYSIKYPKPSSVRSSVPPTAITFYLTQPQEDKWENLYTKIQCLEIFGTELTDLLRIMEKLAKCHKQQGGLLEMVATSLSLTADFHWCFVSTVTPLPEPDLLQTITTLRSACIKAWNGILSFCLSGKLSNWPAAFLGASVVVFSLVIISETIILIPPQARASVWKDARLMFYNLRDHLYAAVTEMLVILAKGAKPLKFRCWDMVDIGDGEGEEFKVRNPEGLRLMKGDEAAFDAMAGIQRWSKDYRSLLENDSWFSSTPLTPVQLRAQRPIAAVSRFVIRTGGAYSAPEDEA